MRTILGALDFIREAIEQQRLEKTIERAKERIVHKSYVEEIVGDRLKRTY